MAELANPALMKVWDGTKLAGVDAFTGALQTIGIPHHEIHEGEMFTVNQLNADFDTNDKLTYTFTAPSNRWVHLFIGAVVSGLSTLVLLESINTIAGGVPVTPINRRRDSSNGSLITDMKSGSTYVNGVTLWQDVFGSAKQKQSGETRDENEWILYPGRTCAVEIVSLALNLVGCLHLTWYEEASEAADTIDREDTDIFGF